MYFAFVIKWNKTLKGLISFISIYISKFQILDLNSDQYNYVQHVTYSPLGDKITKIINLQR